MKELLYKSEIETALADLHGWHYVKGCIEKTVKTEGILKAISFVNSIAKLSEEQNHHPQISINFSKVSLCVTTHDAGGITKKDIELARKIDHINY